MRAVQLTPTLGDIVSGRNRALTAGAAATAACALLIGSPAAAIADPGHRGQHSGQSDRHTGSGDHARDGARRAGDGNAERRTVGARQPEDGSGARVAQGSAAGRSTTTEVGRGTAAPASRARSADPVRRGSDRRPWNPPPGTDYPPPQRVSAQPVTDTLIEAPPVAPVPVHTRAPAVSVAAPQPVVAQEVPVPRVAPLEQSMLSVPDAARPGQPMTSLFGILGLLLIPLAGAALGYRQARAARAVGRLTAP